MKPHEEMLRGGESLPLAHAELSFLYRERIYLSIKNINKKYTIMKHDGRLLEGVLTPSSDNVPVTRRLTAL